MGRARQDHVGARAGRTALQDVVGVRDGIGIAQRGDHLRGIQARHREERERLRCGNAQLRDGAAQGDRLLVGLPRDVQAGCVVVRHDGEGFARVLTCGIARREHDVLGIREVVAGAGVTAHPVHPSGHAVLRRGDGQVDGGVQLDEGRTREGTGIIRKDAESDVVLVAPHQDRVARRRGIPGLGGRNQLLVWQRFVEEDFQREILLRRHRFGDREFMRRTGRGQRRDQHESNIRESSHRPKR